MEWIIAALLLFIALAIGQLANEVRNLTHIIANKHNSPADMSGLSDIADHLKNIFLMMGGQEKLQKEKEQERKKLKERLVDALIKSQGKSEVEAKKEADKLIEDAEFEESHEDWSNKFDSIERWVKAVEIEERNKNKYGHLLPKARDYIKDVKEIKKYDNDFDNALTTNYEGRQWIIQKLVGEKLLEEVKEWNSETETSEVKSWKVIAG